MVIIYIYKIYYSYIILHIISFVIVYFNFRILGWLVELNSIGDLYSIEYIIFFIYNYLFIFDDCLFIHI